MNTTKRLLAMVLAVCMIMGLATPALAAEAGSYIVSDTALEMGSNTLTLDASAETTLYLFQPSETGSFTFTADNADVKVGYWGGEFYQFDATENKTNTLTWDFTDVNQSAMIGVSGAETCTLTVAKVGEAESKEITYTVYTNKHTPDSAVVEHLTAKNAVNVTDSVVDTAVLGEDGFYHLNSADGQLLMVDFNSSIVSITAMLQNGNAKYVELDENGKAVVAIDYTAALTAYCAMGYYPLTDDLIEMLKNVGANKGWYGEGGWSGSTAEDAWMFLCVTAAVDHNLEHVEAVEAGCHTNGMQEYWYCAGCDCYFTDAEGKYNIARLSLVIPAANTLKHNEAVAATCVANGMQEYWYCAGCDCFFTDAEGKYNIAALSLVIPADGTAHVLEHHEAVAATCVADGMQEYWYCAECDCYFTDAEGKYNIASKSLVVPADGTAHVLEHNEAVEVGCHTNGMQEYWYCAECDCYFTDAEGKYNIASKSLVIAAENTLAHEDAVAATCVSNGMQEYWYCAGCDCFFTDAEGKYNIARLSLTIPADGTAHTLEYTAAVEAGCHSNGMQEYWYCADCDCYFTDAEGKYNIARLSLVVPAANTLEHHDAIEAGCHNNGINEYWYCAGCDCFFTDAEGKYNIAYLSLVIPSENTLEHSEAVAATCVADGMQEYWYCEACDCYFTDAEGKMNIARLSLVIPADGTAHVMEHTEGVAATCVNDGLTENWYCSECDCYFLDAEGKQNVARLSLVIPADGASHVMKHYEAVAATCVTDGMEEHWYCTECDTYFYDEAGKYNAARLRLTIPADGTAHVLEHNEEVPATCTSNGMKENWYCTECNCFFTDAEGKYNVAYLSLTTLADGVSHVMTYTEAVEVTCVTDGMPEYWYCAECDCYFSDAEGKKNMIPMRSIIPADGTAHVLESYEAVAATCVADGMKAHVYCSACDTYFVEEEGVLKNVARLSLVIPADGTAHVLEHNEAVEVGCHSNGMQENWYCSECDCYFTDAEGKYNVARLSLVIAAENTLAHEEAVAVTCNKDGMQEYWYCAGCDCFFTDAEGKYNIARLSLVIPADGTDHVLESHEAVAATCVNDGMMAYSYCSSCDTYFVEEKGVLKNVARLSLVIPADGVSHVMEHTEAVEAGCHNNGIKENWYCADCDCYFLDAEGKYNVARLSLVTAAENTLQHFEAIDVTCVENGMQEYWYCAGCDCYFTDAEGKYNIARLSLVIPADGTAHVLEYTEGVEAGCHINGMREYWYCAECDCYFTDEEGKYNIASKSLVIPAEYTLQHNEAVAATCVADGMQENWYCAGCDCYFTDAEGKMNIARLSLVIPADGTAHVLEHSEAVEAGCHINGMQEYWYCAECDCYFTDAEGKYNIASKSLVDLAEYTLEHHEAVAATCVEDGMQEYWYCAGCDCYFTDAEGKYNIASKSLVIPADGTAHVLEHSEGVDPVCHVNGMKEYWYCAECDCYFTDAEGKYNVARLSLVVAAPNALTHNEEVAATCVNNGMQENWYCEACDCYFTDAEGKYNIARLSLTIPADGTAHVLEHHEAVEAVCHVNGMKEYWYCGECDCYFTDAEGKYNIASKSLVIPAEITLEHSEAVAATCTEDGMQEYWYCAECDCYFTDVEGKMNIARLSLVVPAAGHNYVDGVCSVCGASENPFVDVAETDYFYAPALWANEMGITNGYGAADTFAPSIACTRAQVVTFLWRAAGEPMPTIENTFKDIDENDYFYYAVLWALEKGITNGYGSDEIFNPDGVCTRGQVVTFLYRYAGEPEVTGENVFTDVAESAFYYDAILWALENKVTTGKTETTFDPETDCTRGEIVTFLYRALAE